MCFDFKRLRSRALVLLFVVVLSVVLGGASFSPALAVQAATSTSIHLSQATGWVNSQVIVSGSGFAKAEQVNISFDGTLVATTRVLPLSILGPAGRIMASFSVPVTASLGAHVVAAVGQTSGRSAQTSFSVAPAWAQFRFDVAHTGFNPFESTLSPANVAQLTPAWIFQTQGFNSTSSPAVANGLVYIGDEWGFLHALDAFSGTEVWRQGFDGEPTTPATTDTLAYSSSPSSFLEAFDEASGQLQWTDLGIVNSFESAPALADGVLYQAASNGLLYAFSANGCGQMTCNALWNGKIVGNGFVDTPAIANGVVYAGGENGNLYAFSTSTCGTDCAPLWQGTTEEIDASPAIANNVVYIGTGVGKLYAFAAAGCGASVCAPLWSATTGGAIESSAAIANGVVYVGSNDGKLYAFNASGCGQATCQPLWTAATGGPLRSSPAVANGVVYIGSEDGKLYAFNAAGCGSATCAPLWSYTTGAPIASSPAVTDGMVFVGEADTSGQTNIYAFHLP